MSDKSNAQQVRTIRSSGSHVIFDGLVILWLLYMLLCGGVSTPNELNFTLQSLSSLVVVAIAVWRLQRGFPTPFAHLGTWILALCFAIVLFQLIPLPPDWWTQLPGREFHVDMLQALGVETPWQSISLAPDATKTAAIALLPAAAGYLIAISSTPNERIRFLCVMILCSMLGLVVGMVQKLQGPESSFYFYGEVSSVVTGTFGNRNFFAAQLYTSIPFVAALAVVAQEKLNVRNWLVVIFAFIYVGLLMVGLGGTASRAGTALAMVAIVLAAAFIYRKRDLSRSGGAKRATTLAVIAAVLLVSQVGMAAILRVAQPDVGDMRDQVYEVSLTAAKTYFPVGSGFGSFIPVYQMFETPSVMIANYVNHAHNDWVEVILEGGAPAMALALLFLLLFCLTTIQLLRQEFVSSNRAVMRAAAVVVFLLLLHGIVDFGIRTPTLLTIFALCCGMMTLGLQKSPLPKPPGKSPSSTEPRTRSRRPITGFGTQAQRL